MKMYGRMGIKVSYTPRQVGELKWGLDSLLEQRLLALDPKDEDAAISLSNVLDTILSKGYTSNRPIVFEVNKRQYRILKIVGSSLSEALGGDAEEVIEGSPIMGEIVRPVSEGKISRKDVVHQSMVTYSEAQRLLPIFNFIKETGPTREVREGASRVERELGLVRDIDYGSLKGKQVLLSKSDEELLNEVRVALLEK